MSETIAAQSVTSSAAGGTLGARLRAARQESGMSLRELARRVNVSPSFVSQVELGRATPSIGTLYSIVSELKLSLDDVMTEAHRPGDAGTDRPTVAAVTEEAKPLGTALPSIGVLPGLLREGDQPDLQMNGVRWERLTPEDDARVEFLRVTYPPGSESCPPDNLMTHGGKEYIHVLSGELEIQVAFARQTVRPGDSINFDSSTPHRLSNPFATPCVAVWFVLGRQGSSWEAEPAEAKGPDADR